MERNVKCYYTLAAFGMFPVLSRLPVHTLAQADDLSLHLVILYYDYLLTLGDEVRYFWHRRRIHSVTVFFFVNRYVQLIGNVGIVLQTFGNLSIRVSCNVSTFWGQVDERLLSRGEPCFLSGEGSAEFDAGL